MASFTNFATLIYNGGTSNSNTVTGELLETLTLTKTAASSRYTARDNVTYVLSLVNGGTTPLTELALTDNLGGYAFGTDTVYPLTYNEGTLRVYVNGVLQTTPTVAAGAPPKKAPAPETTQDETPRYESGFICAITTQVPYYTEELSEAGTVARGMQITYSTDKSVERDGIRYYLTYFSTLDCGYVSEENLTQDPAAVVAEKAVYVRTPQNLRVDKDTLELGTLVEKGAELQVLSYEGTTDGIVDLYQVAYQGQTGYISGQYVSTVQEEANDVYDRFGVYAIHAGRGDKWGGGDAESLDYFPRTKASFEDNKMPNPCYAIYLTCDPAILKDIDKYIEYAKSTKINAFVVNIMDGTSIGYDSPVYEEYSPTAYQYAQNSVADYQAVIQKIKDAGFYVIGRLTTFNDSFFCQDHPEYAIADGSGEPLYVAASYWPSAFCRYVWEYKAALAIDAVQTMGFNEIQFDYVRFPDNTDQYEASGDIDFRNEYGETKAQAIQRFLMYATDILHEYGVYVGADVFGEAGGVSSSFRL